MAISANTTIEFTSKPFQNIHNIYVFIDITIYDHLNHSNHQWTSPLNSHEKIHSRTYITLTCLLALSYIVTLITKWTSPLNSPQKPLQNIYNTYMFASIAIYGHSNHKTDITIEFTSKNLSKTHMTLMGLPILPYMVTDHKTDITIEFT